MNLDRLCGVMRTAGAPASANCPGIVILPSGIFISLTFCPPPGNQLLNCTWVSRRDRVTEGELATYVLLSVRLSVRLCVCCVDVLRDRVIICCCFFVILFCPSECRSHCCCSCHVGLMPLSLATQPKLRILCLHVLRQFHRLHSVYGQAINVLSCVSVICIMLCELSCCVMRCGACVCVCSCGGGGGGGGGDVFMWFVSSCGGVLVMCVSLCVESLPCVRLWQRHWRWNSKTGHFGGLFAKGNASWGQLVAYLFKDCRRRNS